MSQIRTTEILEDGNFRDFTFHDAAIVAANGATLKLKAAHKTLTVEIRGTSTSRTIAFYEKMSNGTLVPLMGVRRFDFATATSTTGTDEVWEFGIVGAIEIVMDLTAVAGGNVTVKGRAVA